MSRWSSLVLAILIGITAMGLVGILEPAGQISCDLAPLPCPEQSVFETVIRSIGPLGVLIGTLMGFVAYPLLARTGRNQPSPPDFVRLLLGLIAAFMLVGCVGDSSTEAKTPGELLAQIYLEADAAPYDERLDTLEQKCDAPSRMKIADNVARRSPGT